MRQPEGGAKERRGIFEILKGGLLQRKRDMGDHGDRDLLQGNARYRKLQDLNEGTFGVVMLALDTQAREQVAIKFLERGAGERSLTLCLYSAHPLAETVVHKFQAHAVSILLASSCSTPEAEVGQGVAAHRQRALEWANQF